MNKPVNAKTHGIIDYAFSGIQLLGPSLLSLNKSANRTYKGLGAGFLLVNALTKTPVGIKGKLSMKDHRKADTSFLLVLSALSFASMIRKDKTALFFHLGFLSTAIAHYVLTDYNSRK